MTGPGQFAAGNRKRTLDAADRDVQIACQLVTRGGWTARQMKVARARQQYPAWSWTQIGAATGLTKDQAVSLFRRMAVKAGLR